MEEEANRRRELERIERERREEIEGAVIEHERLANEEIERCRTQEAKDLAAQIELEAQLIALEAESSNIEDLKQRLRDFIDDCDAMNNAKEKYPKTGNVGQKLKEDQVANDTASWIANLPPPATNSHPPYQSPFHKSVPKLTLTKFDGDPLKCTDSTERGRESKVGDSWFSLQWKSLQPSMEASGKSVWKTAHCCSSSPG